MDGRTELPLVVPSIKQFLIVTLLEMDKKVRLHGGDPWPCSVVIERNEGVI